MYRSLALALGIVAIVLGVESLAVERVRLHSQQPATQQASFPFAMQTQPKQKEIVVPEWAPWSLMSVGAVILLYNVAINSPGGGD